MVGGSSGGGGGGSGGGGTDCRGDLHHQTQHLLSGSS